MIHLRTIIAVVAISLVAAIGGCGDDEEETTTAVQTATGAETGTVPSGEVVETVDVSETEYELDPADPKISKSGTVEFKATNDGEEAHALEVEGPSGEVETEEIAPGDSATLTADLEPGEYTWYCPIDGHRELGMEGTITVAGDATGSATGEDDETETGEDESERGEEESEGGGY